MRAQGDPQRGARGGARGVGLLRRTCTGKVALIIVGLARVAPAPLRVGVFGIGQKGIARAAGEAQREPPAGAGAAKRQQPRERRRDEAQQVIPRGAIIVPDLFFFFFFFFFFPLSLT
jgi:hypothetical protein